MFSATAFCLKNKETVAVMQINTKTTESCNCNPLNNPETVILWAKCLEKKEGSSKKSMKGNLRIPRWK